MKERDDMYFPYLRGRQFELIALRELVEKDVLSSIRCDMSTGKRKELADHIQYFFAGKKLYAQKGSKIVSVSYDGKEIRVFKKDVVMMDKKEDKIYYRRMDRKKEQMYVCDVDGGMEKMVGNEAGKD